MSQNKLLWNKKNPPILGKPLRRSIPFILSENAFSILELHFFEACPDFVPLA